MKIFALNVRVYGHTGTKIILASTRIEKSKNEDRTLNTKIHGLLNGILRLPVPIFPTFGLRKTAYFRFVVGNGSLKVDGAKA